MSLTASEMSPSDIAAVTGNNNGMFGGEGSWFIILFLILAWGWGGNGYGGNGGGSVKDQYVLSSDFATIQRQLSDGFGAMERKGDSISNGLCDGFYAQNTTMLNGFSGVQQAISNGGYETRNAIQNAQITDMQNFNALQAQLAQCCCDNKAAIADVKYTMAMDTNAVTNAVNTGFCQTNFNNQQNTRDIISNQDANTRAILDSLTQSKLEAKNEKIQEQAQMISALQLAASQQAQNAYLINQLKPCPTPAYVVANPYCGCNTGCGC